MLFIIGRKSGCCALCFANILDIFSRLDIFNRIWRIRIYRIDFFFLFHLLSRIGEPVAHVNECVHIHTKTYKHNSFSLCSLVQLFCFSVHRVVILDGKLQWARYFMVFLCIFERRQWYTELVVTFAISIDTLNRYFICI